MSQTPTDTVARPDDHSAHGHDGHAHDSPRRARAVHVAWLVGAIGVFVGIVAVREWTAQNLEAGIPDALQDLLTLSTSVLVESLPFIVLGIALSILVQVWIPEH